MAVQMMHTSGPVREIASAELGSVDTTPFGLDPPLLAATRREGLNAMWAIDPMHGNTTGTGARKIRRLADILAEVQAFVGLCRAEAVTPAGVHLEMSGLDVTECLGGRGPASVDELHLNWRTACDPRLNRAQALEVADRLAVLLAERPRVLRRA